VILSLFLSVLFNTVRGVLTVFMAEELSFLWGKFSLTEEEDVEVNINESRADPLVTRVKSCLIGKLLADRVIPKDFIKIYMLRAWKPLGSVVFQVLGENLFLMDFECEWDKAHVMEGQPWLFDGNLVSLADFDGFTPASISDGFRESCFVDS
jgi:hypothetical protein